MTPTNPSQHKHPTPSDCGPDECGPAVVKLFVLFILSAACLADVVGRLIV